MDFWRGRMDKLKPEFEIVRIESNFSSSPNHTVSYDILRKAITIRNIDKLVNVKDRCITVTISMRLKLDN
jgi:hypothetical protein